MGKILGYHKTSLSGRPFSAFEGIPYAHPPIGDKRFEAPEPMEPWSGTLHAYFLYECLQQHTGDEDCLYLNVYAPQEVVNTSLKLDVMVHIHGGGFMVGSGHEYASPLYLMDHDVVFVSLNYRLGVFGFLSTEDDVVSGNNGLKDQVMALKWVQKNIAAFGGNPDSVTLTGVSAGGASVHLHYFSPMSLGLFHRGLSRSGCALNPWVFQKGALTKAQTLAFFVGCPQTPNLRLVECLKRRHHRQIMSHISSFYRYGILPISPFGPVIERGSNPFITEEPFQLLKKKVVQDVPWMASFVEHETGALVADLGVEKIDKNWSSIAPVLLHYNNTLPKTSSEEIARKIREFYSDVVQMTTDRITVDGVAKAVSLQAEATNSSVYLYEFKYTGGSKSEVVHYDDNQYFYYDDKKTTYVKMKNFMVKMLLSFVKTGAPEIGAIAWKPVENRKINCLIIESENVRLEVKHDLGNGEFWNSLGLLENENNVNSSHPETN